MSFDDIAGNEYAKEVINETFVLPNMMPHLFKGKARPWQSLLIYGVSLAIPINVNFLASRSRKNNAGLGSISPFECEMYLGLLSRHHVQIYRRE